MSTASKDALDNLHAELAEALKRRVESSDCTASDLNVARAFLKDNNIECRPTADNPIGKLKQALPSFEDDPVDGVGMIQ